MTPRRVGVTIAIASAIVAADQLTKTWALHHLASGPKHVIWTLELNLQLNNGIAFSQVQGAPTLVTVVACAIVAVLVVVAWRNRNLATAVVLGLIMGGAAGNLADRLFRHHGGAVIDFIDLRWWPVFNIADAAVSIGVVLALVRGMLQSPRKADVP